MSCVTKTEKREHRLRDGRVVREVRETCYGPDAATEGWKRLWSRDGEPLWSCTLLLQEYHAGVAPGVVARVGATRYRWDGDSLTASEVDEWVRDRLKELEAQR